MELEDMILLMRVYDGARAMEAGFNKIFDGCVRKGALDDALWVEDLIMKYSVFDKEKDEDIAAFIRLTNDDSLSREQKAQKLMGII